MHLLARNFSTLNNGGLEEGRKEGKGGGGGRVVDSARDCSDHEETAAGWSSPRRDNLFPLQFRQYNARVKILPELYNRAHPPLSTSFFLSSGEIEATYACTYFIFPLLISCARVCTPLYSNVCYL